MTWDSRKISDWLLAEGVNQPALRDLTRELGDQLHAVGAPVSRIRLAMRTVHPLVAAFSAIWERDSGPVETRENTHGLETRSAYHGSPMAYISQNHASFRSDLTALPPDAHIALQELRDAGGTDYYGVPLRIGDHLSGILVVVSDFPSGFSTCDIAGLDLVAQALAPLTEIHRLNLLSAAVADTYLGQRTGKHVLGGEITRGHVERIEAAILISDMRGWTALNATHPADKVVAIANTYFEIMDEAIVSQGGEILKLMGDGVLAIFPAGDNGDTACERAFSAARTALTAGVQTDLRFGIGLHKGTVQYGNVGSDTRLDFTVLGQAVNIAARIEALCEETGRPLLMSPGISDALAAPVAKVGDFVLKGLKHPMAIFAPQD